MAALLALVITCATLILLSVGVSLGIVYLALSSGPFRQTVPIVAASFLPVYLVTFLSRLGVRSADQITLSDWKLALAIGFVITLGVSLRKRNEMKLLFFSRATIISAAAGAGSLVLFLVLNSTEPFAYNYLGNGEFLNYARLASAMIDQKPVHGFLEHHRLLRYGQDIFLGALSEIFRRQPIELVHGASAYLLFSYGTTVGIIVTRTFGTSFLALMLLAIHSVTLLPLFNFSASFFSSTVTISSMLLVIAYCSSEQPYDAERTIIKTLFKSFGEIGLLVAFIVFALISYPEFALPVIGVSICLSFFETCRQSRLSRSFIALSVALVSTCMFRFPLILNGVSVFLNQLASSGGWNMFGDLRSEPTRFVLSAVGLSFPLSNMHIGLPVIVQYAVLFAAPILLGTAVWQAKFYMPQILGPLALWLVVAIFVVFSPFYTGKHWYSAVKYFAQFEIGFIFVIGVTLVRLSKSGKSSNRLLSHVLLAGTFGCYLIVCVCEVAFARRNIEVLSLKSWTNILEAQEATLPFVVFTERDGEIIWFAELVAGAIDTTLIPVSTQQVERLNRGPAVTTGCRDVVKGLLPLFDFSHFSHLNNSFLALIGIEEPLGWVTGSQGVSLQVLNQSAAGRLGRFRIDHVTVDMAAMEFAFPHESWAIDGVWSACVPSRYHAFDIHFDVPEAMIVSGPVDVALSSSNSRSNIRIFRPGTYSLASKSNSANLESDLLILSATASWAPQEVDPTSSDTRRLGVRVNRLSMH